MNENRPAGHATHDDAWRFDDFPAAQATHAVWAAVDVYVPEVQLMHAVKPVLAANNPLAQLVQAVADMAAAYFPPAQN